MIDDRVRSEVAGTALDPARADGPLLVSVTPFGFDADDAGRHRARGAGPGAQRHHRRAGRPGPRAAAPARLAGPVPRRRDRRRGRARRPADAGRPPHRRLVDGVPDDGLRAALRRRDRRRAPLAADRPVPDHRVPGRGTAVPRRLRGAGQLPRRRLGDAVPAVRPARAARRRALPHPRRARRARRRGLGADPRLVRRAHQGRDLRPRARHAVDRRQGDDGRRGAGRSAPRRARLLRPARRRPMATCVAPVRPFRTAGLPVADQRVRAAGESDGDRGRRRTPRPCPVRRSTACACWR